MTSGVVCSCHDRRMGDQSRRDTDQCCHNADQRRLWDRHQRRYLVQQHRQCDGRWTWFPSAAQLQNYLVVGHMRKLILVRLASLLTSPPVLISRGPLPTAVSYDRCNTWLTAGAVIGRRLAQPAICDQPDRHVQSRKAQVATALLGFPSSPRRLSGVALRFGRPTSPKAVASGARWRPAMPFAGLAHRPARDAGGQDARGGPRTSPRPTSRSGRP
jgi:hypothetical protein